MQAPKRKTSKSKRNMRRSHHRAGVRQSSLCGNCNEATNAHSICSHCGHYRGKQYFDLEQN